MLGSIIIIVNISISIIIWPIIIWLYYWIMNYYDYRILFAVIYAKIIEKTN